MYYTEIHAKVRADLEKVRADRDELPKGTGDLEIGKEFERLYQIEEQLKDEEQSHAPRYEVGDGVTDHGYSDARAYTVVEVSKNGKVIKVQRDKAVLQEGSKPELHVGGFSAHCSNNRQLIYDYSRNQSGTIITFSLRADNRWIEKGIASKSSCAKSLTSGRHEFYDYNF